MAAMSDDPNAAYVIAHIWLSGPGEGYSGYTPVPAWAVDDAINVLQCYVAHYTRWAPSPTTPVSAA